MSAPDIVTITRPPILIDVIAIAAGIAIILPAVHGRSKDAAENCAGDRAADWADSRENCAGYCAADSSDRGTGRDAPALTIVIIAIVITVVIRTIAVAVVVRTITVSIAVVVGAVTVAIVRIGCAAGRHDARGNHCCKC
jgi:Flp pilus assembly protein TadB